ncbi:MAG: hypothetical protein PHQ75_09360 [Thermoguttaceae bacterium]|nr:hypothetical protein [Thermoguttaceae bacterium]
MNTQLQEIIEQSEKKDLEQVRKRAEHRGGVRPNSGRPKGSGSGRTATARLQFCVTPEFKTEFEQFAQKMNISSIELLRRLFRKRNILIKKEAITD